MECFFVLGKSSLKEEEKMTEKEEEKEEIVA